MPSPCAIACCPDQHGGAVNPYYPLARLFQPWIPTSASSFPPACSLWAPPSSFRLAGSAPVFAPVSVQYLNGESERIRVQRSNPATCSFIQGDGTGFGICKSCRLGGLAGSKK